MSLGSAEQRFLLRAALELAPEQHALDWGAVAGRARQLWLSGLAWRAVSRRQVPEAAPLQRDALQVTAHTALVMNAFVRVTRVLGAAGLECMALKGVALVTAEPAYGPLRAVSDVDLLVRERDVDAVDEALRAAGFRRAARRPTLAGEHALAALAGQPFASAVADYVTDTSVPLDLHVRPPAQVEGGVDGLWSRSIRARLEGVEVRIPSLADQLVIACDHALQHHAPDPRLLPRHLADVLHLQRLGAIDVERPVRLARSVEASLTMLEDALAVAERRVPVPRSRVARAVSPTWSGLEGAVRKSAHRVRWNVAFGRRVGLRALFPSRSYLASSYGVPERAWWLPALHVRRLLVDLPLSQLGRDRPRRSPGNPGPDGMGPG